ncbi:IS66 family insertion sequence element accessory protein TnpB [Roseateles noduli]|uniref:IS66 family insertion sequence element accessory protein TnpB n=1 Tax=Roseateles noduli TaxID=2052484 RepID=UPI003D661B23
MRAGTETVPARMVQVFGGARPHRTYLFANRSATRMKVLVHAIGVWLAARRLHRGRFVWPREGLGEQMPLTQALLQAVVLGLPPSAQKTSPRSKQWGWAKSGPRCWRNWPGIATRSSGATRGSRS